MTAADRFFDTNVVLYLLSGDVTKAQKAEDLLAVGGVISVQVLNEFTSVASRKLGLTWLEIREVLQTVKVACTIVPLTLETHDRATQIAERYKLSFYDSAVLAAAELANCVTLYSEDMSHGQSVGTIRIENPFMVR